MTPERIVNVLDGLASHLQTVIVSLKESPKSAPKPVTTVTVWEKCAVQGCTCNSFISYKYAFRSTPDIDRIIAETLEQGALAIKVECTEEFECMSESHKSIHLWKKEIGLIAERGWAFRRGASNYNYLALYEGITDFNIESTITAWLDKEREPKPLTKDDLKRYISRMTGGQPKWQPEVGKQALFVGYPTQLVTIEKGCQKDMKGSYLIRLESGSLITVSSYNLSEPPKPAFEVGDIVMWQGEIHVIMCEYEEGRFILKDKKGSEWSVMKEFVRLATLDEIDEFYTVDGIRVYEDCERDLRFYYEVEHHYLFPTKMARALCAKAGIPIMSWSQVKKYYDGEFRAPKGDK